VSAFSTRAILAPAVNFRSTPKNGHRADSQDGSAPCPWGRIETTATSENCPCGRSAKSHAVAYSRVLACVRLRRHSATAKQYCPSSSAVARHYLGLQIKGFLQFLLSFLRPFRVAKRCKPVSAFSIGYRTLQFTPRNTDATRRFGFRSQETGRLPNRPGRASMAACPPSPAAAILTLTKRGDLARLFRRRGHAGTIFERRRRPRLPQPSRFDRIEWPIFSNF
jgi:hypothetical protein